MLIYPRVASWSQQYAYFYLQVLEPFQVQFGDIIDPKVGEFKFLRMVLIPQLGPCFSLFYVATAHAMQYLSVVGKDLQKV